MLVEQLIDRRRKAQRVTAARVVQRAGDAVAERLRRQAASEIGLDLFHRESAEPRLRAPPALEQARPRRDERVAVGERLRPVRGDDEELGIDRAAGELGERVDRRGVAPLKIFEHQDEGLLGGERLHGFAELEQPAFPARGGHPPAEAFGRGVVHPAGELEEPAGCAARQRRHDVVPRRLVAEPAQEVEDGRTAFAAAVQLERLAARATDAVAPQRLQELVEQRRLARAGFARHEDDLAPTAAGARQRLVQSCLLGVAPDEDRCRDAGLERKAVAAAWDGGEEAIRLGPERRADLPDGHAQHARADRRPGPDRALQLGVGHAVGSDARRDTAARPTTSPAAGARCRGGGADGCLDRAGSHRTRSLVIRGRLAVHDWRRRATAREILQPDGTARKASRSSSSPGPWSAGRQAITAARAVPSRQRKLNARLNAWNDCAPCAPPPQPVACPLTRPRENEIPEEDDETRTAKPTNLPACLVRRDVPLMNHFFSVLVALAATLAVPDDARAGCNLIPGTAKSFSAALGATNRPYAAPGERLEIRLRSCDASPGFLLRRRRSRRHPVVPSRAPARTRPRSCSRPTAASVDLAACSAAPGVVSATCGRWRAGELQTRIDVDERDRRLTFTFPDTDALLAPDGDDVTLAGPVAIGVTAAGAPPACGLATAPCAAQTGLLACVDALYANDGACGTAVPQRALHALHRAAAAERLPGRLLQRRSALHRDGDRDRATAVDAAGNLLMPIGWGGVLVRDAGVPVPRLIRTRFASPLPFTIPAQVVPATRSRPRAGSCRRSSSRSSTRPWRRPTS